MDRPRPEDYQPTLTLRSQLLRLLGCALISAILWTQVAENEWQTMRWLFWTEILLGGAAYLLVLARRSHPLPVALVVAALSTCSGIAAGPATLAAVSLAARRQLWPILVVGVVNFAAATTYGLTAPYDPPADTLLTVLVNLVINGGMMGWGMYIGSRRELLWTLRQRAERAEAEQQLRVAQARGQERARIAREMHDVVAHQITQVSMTAGAMAFRDDLPADDLRTGLGQVRDRANQALHELRGVLGVLRDPETGEALDQPQPTYADVAREIEDARRGGMTLDLTDEVRAADELPAAVGRAVFRIVREGITNARRHAPGAHLHVTVTGGPDIGITVRLANALGFGRSGTPGSGYGLVGLTERAELRGGRLDHWVEGEAFVVEAWLPWTT